MKHNTWGGPSSGYKPLKSPFLGGSKTFDPQLLFGEQPPPPFFLKKTPKLPPENVSPKTLTLGGSPRCSQFIKEEKICKDGSSQEVMYLPTNLGKR